MFPVTCDFLLSAPTHPLAIPAHACSPACTPCRPIPHAIAMPRCPAILVGRPRAHPSGEFEKKSIGTSQSILLGLHNRYYIQGQNGTIMFNVTSRITYKNMLNWHYDLEHMCENIPCMTHPLRDTSPARHIPCKTHPLCDTSPARHIPCTTHPLRNTSPARHIPCATHPLHDTSPA